MTGVKLRFKDAEVRRWLRRMPARVAKATSRGLNQGVKQVRTAGNRSIRSRRPLKVAEVNSAMKIIPAHPRRLTAIVRASGRSIPLTRYKMKVQAGRGRRRKGAAAPRSPVTVEVTRGRRRTIRGAFTNKARNQVLRRKGAGRTPLDVLMGPSIPGTFRTKRVTRAMSVKARRKVPGLIERQIRREVKRGIR